MIKLDSRVCDQERLTKRKKEKKPKTLFQVAFCGRYQRPDEVGVKHLCVPSYITLHALVCFPSGGCKGGGENGRRRGGGRFEGGGVGYLLDSTVTMSLPQQFSKHIINTRLGARAFKY